RSFIIKGYRSSRSRGRHSYFQPLSIVDIVFWQKDNRSLQKITDSKINILLQEAQTDPIKMSIGLAMMEIFYDTVKEEEVNPQLYQFLRSVILRIDQEERHLVNLFIYYLLHLSRYLGFFPNDKAGLSGGVHFDIRLGTFSAAVQNPDAIAKLLLRFYRSQLEDCQDITFSTLEKRHLIRTLFSYYEAHVEGFKYPQTLRVFSEVFGG
ncbi:MAG: DNA repair protein RecO, partial [Bacteroidia bacterium]